MTVLEATSLYSFNILMVSTEIGFKLLKNEDSVITYGHVQVKKKNIVKILNSIYSS